MQSSEGCGSGEGIPMCPTWKGVRPSSSVSTSPLRQFPSLACRGQNLTCYKAVCFCAAPLKVVIIVEYLLLACHTFMHKDGRCQGNASIEIGPTAKDWGRLEERHTGDASCGVLDWPSDLLEGMLPARNISGRSPPMIGPPLKTSSTGALAG